MTRPAPAFINAPYTHFISTDRMRLARLEMVHPRIAHDNLTIDMTRGWDGYRIFADFIDDVPVTVHQLRALRDMIDFVLCEGPYSHVPAIAAPGRAV